MFAFWKKIKAREGQGAAQMFDTDAALGQEPSACSSTF
jgi:hypothetical protein